MSDSHSPPLNIWNENERLLRDLQLMLKRDGFTSTRVAKAPTLRQVLGGGGEPFEVLRERLISAIQSLNNSEPEMLLDTFALSPETERIVGLPDRYVHYGNKAGIKIDTVRNQVAIAIDHLSNSAGGT
jgi:hypothetical protein